MLKVGMVGAENSHTAAIARVLNVDKAIRGVQATHVWGETKASPGRPPRRGRSCLVPKR
jgi:hypothetical protein